MKSETNNRITTTRAQGTGARSDVRSEGAAARSRRGAALARSAARGVLVLVPVLLPLGLALELGTAGAQVDDRVERELVLAVARVAVNEAGLSASPADVAMIWQTAEGHGETARERLAWLRAHSPCVLGSRDPASLTRPGNCAWTRHLDDSDREPAGWSERYPHLAWSRYASRWRQVRELVRRLVAGELELRPCPVAPHTWGGALDHERALERGLVPIDCRGDDGRPTLNRGYVRGGGRS